MARFRVSGLHAYFGPLYRKTGADGHALRRAGFGAGAAFGFLVLLPDCEAVLSPDCEAFNSVRLIDPTIASSSFSHD